MTPKTQELLAAIKELLPKAKPKATEDGFTVYPVLMTVDFGRTEKAIQALEEDSSRRVLEAILSFRNGSPSDLSNLSTEEVNSSLESIIKDWGPK